MATSWRVVLAVALWAGFYFLALALTLCLIASTGIMFYGAVDLERHWSFVAAAQILVTLAISGSGLVAMIGGVFPALAGTPEPRPDIAVEVPRDCVLWSMVVDLAKQVGTAPPTHLYLTSEVNIAVQEPTRLLGLKGQARSMDIGIPLMALLSQDQLSAVLCHELGHYSNNDTRLGSVIRRGHAAVILACLRLSALRYNVRLLPLVAGTANFISIMFVMYSKLYLHVTTVVARRQELHADALAARILQQSTKEAGQTPDPDLPKVRMPLTGAHMMAQALCIAHFAPAAWADFRARHLDPVRRQGVAPDDPFRAFRRMVADVDYQEEILEKFMLAALDTGPAGRFASHPSLRQRLANLDPDDHLTIIDAHVTDEPNPLLAELEPLVAQVARRMFPSARISSTLVPEQEWLEHAAEFQARTAASRLARAALSLAPGSDQQALALTLDLLSTGRSTRLAASIDALPDANSDLEEALHSLIGLALVAKPDSAWNWSISWTGRSPLAGPIEDVEGLRHAVRQALKVPEKVHDLRRHLASLGVDPTNAPSPACDTSIGGAGDVLRLPALDRRKDLIDPLSQLATVLTVAVTIGLQVVPSLFPKPHHYYFEDNPGPPLVQVPQTSDSPTPYMMPSYIDPGPLPIASAQPDPDDSSP